MTHFLRRYWLALAKREEGSVFVMVAASALLLITVTGTAVDMARAQMLQAKISSALDAAGLAAGNTANTVNVETQAQKYFNANFPSGYLGSGAVTVTATLSTDKSTVSLSASAVQPTTFLQAVGINSVNVSASSQITRANEGMELVLVLDNTGSMADPVDSSDSSVSKIQALINAVSGTGGLLDILYGTNTTIPNMWIGVVPFTDIINIGTGHSGWLDTTYDATLDFGPVVYSNSCPAYSGTPGSYSSNPGRCAYTLSGTSTPNFGLTNWSNCVTARSATTTSTINPPLTLDASDDPPAATGTFFQAFYNITTATGISGSNKCTGGSNAWNCSQTNGSGSNKTTTTMYNAVTSSTGPNLNCIQAAILPMTATKTNVANEVNAMTANGSTMINLGMAWGFRMLSPNWTGLWGGEMNAASPQLPLPYHTALMNKVVILMTDGMNNTSSGTAYQGQSTPSDATLDSSTKAICDTLKANGVIIYTIGFGTDDSDNPNNPTSVDGPLLKYCATQMYSGDTSHYFLAPTNTVLATAFAQIGDQLANLRISK